MNQAARKTNIIILTYNKLDYTQLCVSSIRRFTKPGTYRMIIVDNASTDGTREWLADQTDIITIFNENNLGFPKGCNQGIKLTQEEDVLLLNNDVVVTENWLELLQSCLYSSPDIGAVGPSYNGDSEIDDAYHTIDEMLKISANLNRDDSSKWEPRLKLIGFAMLIKNEVIKKVGLLDEQFSPGNCEDTDYSFRIIQQGYKILFCKNVFIHHFGSISFGDSPEQYNELLVKNRGKFLNKWGFASHRHSNIRRELISLIDRGPEDDFDVLDVGCACGATLLQIGYQYPAARLFGVERNPQAAEIASTVAEVQVADVEVELPYLDHSFDYILLGSVVEELVNPLKVLNGLRKLLKPGGVILAGIANVMHYSVFSQLFKGSWNYTDAGPLSGENLRFYTLTDAMNLFSSAGMNQVQYYPQQYEPTMEIINWVDQLAGFANIPNKEQLLVHEYLFRVTVTAGAERLTGPLQAVSQQIEVETNLVFLSELVQSGETDMEQLLQAIGNLDTVDNKILLYNLLATSFYKSGLYNDVIPLLNAALELDSTDQTTLYNYAFILNQVGAHEQALLYLNGIADKDQDTRQLLASVQKSLDR